MSEYLETSEAETLGVLEMRFLQASYFYVFLLKSLYKGNFVVVYSLHIPLQDVDVPWFYVLSALFPRSSPHGSPRRGVGTSGPCGWAPLSVGALRYHSLAGLQRVSTILENH